MTILITGSTGKTAREISKILLQKKVPFLIASRKGQPETSYPGLESAAYTKFDFTDPETFSLPFSHKQAGKIDAAYLVGPPVPNSAVAVNEFVDYARKEHGVNRFVLLASQSADMNSEVDPWGRIWKHLEDIGADYGVLAPTWFMENFSDPSGEYPQTIKKDNKVYSSTGTGTIPAVAASDVAAMATELLTTKERLKGARYPIFGPEAHTVQEIVAIINRETGRNIEHVPVTSGQKVEMLKTIDLPEGYKQRLPQIEARMAEGATMAGWPDDTFRKVLGRDTITVAEWAERNKAAWQ